MSSQCLADSRCIGSDTNEEHYSYGFGVERSEYDLALDSFGYIKHFIRDHRLPARFRREYRARPSTMDGTLLTGRQYASVFGVKYHLTSKNILELADWAENGFPT